MKFHSMFLKISLAFVLLLSAVSLSPASNSSPLSFNNVAEAASCKTVKFNGYQYKKISKKQMRVGGAVAAVATSIAGGWPGGLIAGTASYASSGTPITLRVYSAYCTQSSKKYLKQNFYVYNYANNKKLKGPYTRMFNMQGSGTGVK